MKVLSIKEPFATLICNHKKTIETRSYNTNYRGTLYIHASISEVSKTKLNNKELMNILGDDELSHGKIICKCKLVDSVYMTNEFIEKIKKDNQEYICGHYEVGRYAWVLEDVEPLNEKIPATGNLGIWNYYNEDAALKIMNEIEYGYVDNNKVRHTDDNNFINKDYILQSPQNVLKNKLGICYDQVELERYLLQKNKWEIKTFFIKGYDKDNNCHTHTFLIYKKDNKYHWFEHSWNKYKGIHKFNNMELLLKDIKSKFIESELKNSNNIELYEYKKPKYNISLEEYNNHCLNGVKYE